MLSGPPYRFADFELDPKSAMLRRAGVPVRLRPQAFKVLALLVSRAGEVVTRDEIRGEIWSADTFVDFNQGLNACIKQIREALGDEAESPRFIETSPRLGYRFVARLEATATDSPVGAAESSPPSRAGRSLRLALPMIGVAAIVAFVVWRFWPAHAAPGRAAAVRSIAVLPLVNLTGDAEHAYLADGMTEALINDLASVRGVHVISRTSSMQYRETHKPIPQIVQELHVDAVIEGSVQRSGDRVRTTVQLIDGATDQPLWASSYDRDVRDVLTLQREVADAIVREIRAEVPTAAPVRRRSPQSLDPAAFEAYLKGRFFWNKRNKEGFQNAIKYFEDAIRLDPNYAEAYAGLADTLALFTNAEQLPRDDGYRRATHAARTALALDDTLAEAHTSLGFILQKYNFDFQGAERELSRAIELNPNYATAHQWRATNFNTLGKFDDAYAEMKLALANDPLSFAINIDFASALARTGKCVEALEREKSIVEMFGGSDRQAAIGGIPVFCGKFDETIAVLEGTAGPDESTDVKTIGFLGYAYARTGRLEEARRALQLLQQKKQKSALLYVAEIYAALGDRDKAIDALERLYASKDERILGLLFHPMLDPLHGDPRFQSLLKRLNLPVQ